MDVLDTIRDRRSTRAFRDEPVSRELLERILIDASRAPSAINMQPWEVTHDLGGGGKKAFTKAHAFFSGTRPHLRSRIKPASA